MKKKYSENDEIELRLVQYVRPYYDLQWRFKEPRKFLFFNVKPTWRTLSVYSNSMFDPKEDPNDDFYWHNVYFNMGRNSDVQDYESMKGRIKTKKDLFDYYNIKEKVNLYFDHLAEHRKWVEQTDKNIQKHTN